MRNRLIILFIGILFAAITFTCSSGYITPASLTATAAATRVADTPFPTAFLVVPTGTETETPEPSETPDPLLFSPTPTEPTFTPLPPSLTPSVTADVVDVSAQPILYYAQSGDSLDAVAAHFAVNPFEIVSDQDIPNSGFIRPGQLLVIPDRLTDKSSPAKLIPDSDLVYSPSASDFNANIYASTFNGHLTSYRAYLGDPGWATGPEIIQLMADQNSINPRILLSLLEYQSHWVLGEPQTFTQTDYPMGYIRYRSKELHAQLGWAINKLSEGYYGWRRGSFTYLSFSDGTVVRLNPELNAGTVAIHYFFAQTMSYDEYLAAVDPETGFAALHNAMFGDAWARASTVEPLLPSGLQQPQMILPFLKKQIWAYTGGPHGAWEVEGPMAAIDFAPGSSVPGCFENEKSAVAVAPGIVVRRDIGVVVLDLDGDQDEQTGWNVLYLHIAAEGAPIVGKWLDRGDYVGRPSCEGGRSTGTHLHIARKYNGEWLEAGGAIPFNLSGWVVAAGPERYLGTLTRDDKVIEACTCSNFATNISRTEDDPY